MTKANHWKNQPSIGFNVKLMLPKKVTKIDEIFPHDLTSCRRREIDGEDFVNFCEL